MHMKPNFLLLATLSVIAAPLMANEWTHCYETPPGYTLLNVNDYKARFYGEVEYLGWYADQEGMSYASIINYNVDPAAPKTRDLHFKTKWDSGVRAILGFKPASKNWDMRAAYTYFYTESHPRGSSSTAILDVDASNVTTISGSVIAPAYYSTDLPSPGGRFRPVPPYTVTGTYAIDPQWHLWLNQADLEIGTEFYLNCDAKIRTFGGFRGVWINQKFNLLSNFINDIAGGVTTTLSSDLYEKNQMSAFGARTGVLFNYTLGYGLDIYTGLAGSLLWSWFTTKQSYFTTASDDIPNNSEKGSLSHHTNLFNYDVEIGLQWNYWMNCNRNLLTIKFGWEQHLYTNVNQFQTFINTPSLSINSFNVPGFFNDRNIQRGDLSLSGFIAGISYTY